MSNLDKKPSSRRSPYQKFSDTVFAKTGMPVARVLIVIVGLLLLGGAILYATREVDESSQIESEATKKKDFLEAITIPTNFSDSPFPVKIEKLDLMLERCDHLLKQESEYSVRIRAKRIAIIALKSMTMAENGMDPMPTLDLFQKSIDQIGSPVEKDKHLYLALVTYMKILAENPSLDLNPALYTQAIAAVSAIQETTPVQRTKAIISYNSALSYYSDSEDKVKSGKLLQLLGERLATAKDEEVSDYGFSMIDFPNYFYSFQESINQSSTKSRLESETIQLFKKIEDTPPQSVQTYNALMHLPEQHLQAGNKMVAQEIFERLSSAASSSAPRIRDKALVKLTKLKNRIALLENPFPLSGFDAAGKTIGPPQKEQTLIVFFSHYEKSSEAAMRRVANSPLRDEWSTTTYLASVSEMSVAEVRGVQDQYPDFIIVDGPTSKDWLEKSGVVKVPYLITLDSAGVVERVSYP